MVRDNPDPYVGSMTQPPPKFASASSGTAPIPDVDAGDRVSFGPFTLIVDERLLTRDGVPLSLGGRALDVLIVLVARAGTVVSKQALMAEAWPGVIVSEGSLRFQITQLRQALGDGIAGARYITNVVGRGYSFVADLSAPSRSQTTDAPAAADQVETHLPAPASGLVGRDEDIAAIVDGLVAGPFFTLVGAGGVGKTTVAVQVGHALLERFGGAIVFVDFAALSDPSLASSVMASMLRLSVRSTDPVPSVIAYLRDKQVLLILDNCEHVIDAAASLAERITQAAPGVRVLATSREPLRAQGEHVYRLGPLASPPEQPVITAAMIMSFPATRLFVERAGASGATLEVNDADAPVIARICRKLDGLALAIELAARRVASFGLPQTAALLDERLTLAWRGQRTAQPRHQTLRATLDWSYELLDGEERQVLCQLPVFVGDFTLDAARQVVAAEHLSQEHVVATIASLAEKSLLAVHRSGPFTHYRLLESTRAYALSRAADQVNEVALRHARYVCQRLEQVAAREGAFSRDAGGATALADLGNVRAALAWCFGLHGDKALGVALAAAAVPAFLAMSLLAECHHWAERALGSLGAATRGSRAEMHLQAALGLSLMFTRGNSLPARAALERSLHVAETLGDAPSQVQLLGGLQIFHERIGEFVVSLRHAQRSAVVATNSGDPTALATAHAMVGLCMHLVGDQGEARTRLEAALAASVDPQRASTIYFGFDHRNRAGIALARTLWLQGWPARAVLLAQRTVDEASRLDHPVTLCIALIWAVSVYLWVGDHARAEQDIDRFIAYAESHSLGPYLAVGRGVKGELAVRRGDVEPGVQAIADCLVELREARYELLTTAFSITLAEGLTGLGRNDEALALIEQTVTEVEANGDLYNLPELLRVRARTLLRAPAARAEEAQASLLASLDLSRRQGALAWELRATTDLARLWAQTPRAGEARNLLKVVLARFEEGFETADLREATLLLRSFSAAN